MIKQNDINNIIETARIEEVVGDFITLKKRGANYMGLCPFHNEKTPSFTVSPAKGIFKCFGCGKAGNAVGFVMEHEHYTFPEALKYLAKKYNIEIEEEERTPEQKELQNERESLYNLNEFARQYFVDVLRKDENARAVALSYLHERDFNDRTIDEFQIGYCPDSFDSFTKHAVKSGYKLDMLVKSGLTIKKEYKQYDRFRGRIIFPIHNLTGRILGFGGRTMKKEEKLPKYVNSPETEIYEKSRVLYGIFFAKNAIIKADECLLVEGYTDVMTLYQAGFKNVVASSGTSLTTQQIRLIRRYTNNITILFDGDEAGLKASFRGIDMILEQGMNVKIIMFPEGEDPDSYVRSHRSSEVEEFFKNAAADFIRFKTGLLLKEAKDDPVKRASLIREIITSVAAIPDGITRNVYIRECSNLMDIPEQTLMNELNKILAKKYKKKRSEPVEVEQETEPIAKKQTDLYDLHTAEYQEREVIRLMLQYGTEKLPVSAGDEEGQEVHVAEFIVRELEEEVIFTDESYKLIFEEFRGLIQQGEVPDATHFTYHADSKISARTFELLADNYELSPNWKKKHKIDTPFEKELLSGIIEKAIYALKSKMLDRLIREVQNNLKNAKGEEVDELLGELKHLKKMSDDIYSRLNRVVTK